MYIFGSFDAFQISFNIKKDAIVNQDNDSFLKVVVDKKTIWDIEWNLNNFIRRLKIIYPRLVNDNGYPFGIRPKHPGLIMEEINKRWETLHITDKERDVEDKEIFGFRFYHDLSLHLCGIYPNSLWIVKEGGCFQLWSNVLKYPVLAEESNIIPVLDGFIDTYESINHKQVSC